MLTPEEFPYIKSLHVNDCYAYQNFDINLHDYKPFSHLILTGKNGSGKSTILREIHQQFSVQKKNQQLQSSKLPAFHAVAYNQIREEGRIKVIKNVSGPGQVMLRSQRVVIAFSVFYEINEDKSGYRKMDPGEILELHLEMLYSYFEAKRGYSPKQVKGPSQESEFIDSLKSGNSTDVLTASFKQYLVNKKIDQAFAQIDRKADQAMVIDKFFEELRLQISDIFNQRVEIIEFDHKKYDFYLHLEDGRKLTFEKLPDGFSALLGILMDLFIRVDIIRKQVNDYSYDPCGIVLIDEPETHLHLQLQEQVLPILTSLFPNIQFIAATHSPAVIASIKNATIFDLTTKEIRVSEETVGRSYSDLMVSHFGLENEYSGTADNIIDEVNSVLSTLGDKPEEMKQALQKVYNEHSAYLSPTLKIELELLIAQQEAQQIAHQ